MTFLAQASAELARNDLQQASEKGWGAAAQMAKAVASERSWPHTDHRALYQVVGRLADEVGDQEVRRLFAIAGQLHTNFYEGWLSHADIELLIGDVNKFVDRVDAVLTNGA